VSTVAITTSELGLTFSRTFRTTRAALFRAFTIPELLARWWGPPAWPMASCTLDLRPGGLWHYCLRSAEGQEHWALAEYREIREPERIRYLERSSDPAGSITEDMPPALTTVTFTEQGQHATLTSHVTFPTTADRDRQVRRGMVEGFSSALDQLHDLLEEQSWRP
jgi:uncharacterized protein YndB with AHSA1/START domain